MIVKKHRDVEGGIVLAICDKEILGVVLEDGDFVLNIDPYYFGDEEVTESEILRILPKVKSATICGKIATEWFIKKGLLDNDKKKGSVII